MKHLQKISIILFLAGIFLVFGINLEAEAAIGMNNAIDRILDLYQSNAHAWESTLQSYAISLFWILAGIEFTWTAIRLVVKGADFSEFLAELVNRILFIGFFLTLLLHSSEWAGGIVQSFRMAANAASGSAGGSTDIAPSNILDSALVIVTKLMQHSTIFNPADAIISGIAAVAILICFALMAASLIEALIESYIVMSAGVIFMGFGGSSWTSEYAKKILVYAVSVGAKLFVIQLLLGLAGTLIQQLASEFDGSRIEDALVMLGVSVIFFVITRNIPHLIQGLINGTSMGHANTMSAAVSAGVAAGVAAVASSSHFAAGSVYSALGAGKLASEQLKDEDAQGTAPESKLARAASWTGSAAKNLRDASIEDVGGRLSGRNQGTMGGRMGQSMYFKANEIVAAREKPKQEKTQKVSNGAHESLNIIRPQ